MKNPKHILYALKKQPSKFSTKAWQRRLNSHEGENERQLLGVIASKKFIFYLKITCVSCILLHNTFLFVLISVQFSLITQSFLTLCDSKDCSMPGPPVHHQLREFLHKLMSIEPVMPSKHLILCRPLLLLPSIFPNIRVFPNESVFPSRWPVLDLPVLKLQLQPQSFQ